MIYEVKTNLSSKVRVAMQNYCDYWDTAAEIINELNDMYDSHVLSAAIACLIKYVELYSSSESIFTNAGYTVNDAMILAKKFDNEDAAA